MSNHGNPCDSESYDSGMAKNPKRGTPIEVTKLAHEAFRDLCEERGFTQKDAASRLVLWLSELTATEQVMLCGGLPAKEVEPLAKLLLRKPIGPASAAARAVEAHRKSRQSPKPETA